MAGHALVGLSMYALVMGGLGTVVDEFGAKDILYRDTQHALH